MNIKQIAIPIAAYGLLSIVSMALGFYILTRCDNQVRRIASPDGARTLVRTTVECMLDAGSVSHVLEMADEWGVDRRFTLPPFSYAWKDPDALSACWPRGGSPSEGDLAQLTWWPIPIEFTGSCP